MAEASLKEILDITRDGINIRAKYWENVIANFTEGYEIAKKQHENNLPVKLTDDVVILIFSLIAAGSTAWLAGGWVVAMTPIASAITKMGENLASPPDSSIIPISAAPGTSETYFRFLNSSLNTIVANMLEHIRKCREILNDKGDVKIPVDQKIKIGQALELSPFWHSPSKLSIWNEELQKEIAIEFEMGFWAEWAKALKAASPNDIRKYNFDKVSKRLEDLKITIPPSIPSHKYSFQQLAIKSGKSGRTRSIGGGMNNTWWASDVAEWGKNYKPVKQFGDPLPSTVEFYMLDKSIPEDDFLKKGLEFLSKMGLKAHSYLNKSISEIKPATKILPHVLR